MLSYQERKEIEHRWRKAGGKKKENLIKESLT